MRAAIVLAILSVALAGCFTPEAGEPVEGAAVEGSPETTSREDGAASAKASPSSAGTDPTPAADGDATLVPREFPFAFEGRTGTSACLPSGPNSCMGPPVPLGAGGENVFTPVEYDGTPDAASITLSWEAQTPAADEMVLSLFAVRSCGDGCFEWDGDMFQEYAVGTSPLTIDAEDIQLGENETLYMHVSLNEPNPSAGPLYMSYSLEQPFAVEGVLRALVPQA